MAHGISVPSRDRPAPRGPKRLLALRADEHLVERLRRGDETAFEVIYERHVPGLLSFCRHMLGSREEAEDAVQHAFTSAHRALLRDEREVRLKPWLYSIARNRCVSILRARREQADENLEPSTDGLEAEVHQRADLRQLVEDLQDLPEDQRAALVLSELRDLSHAEVADILGCKVANVKGLVFRARAGLTERREARDTPCLAIREELATARGGALRRGSLRHHVRACPGCSAYLDEVRHQRKMMAAILPVIPTAGLKSGVLAAVGIGGGAAAGGGAAGGGLLATLLPAGGATAAKVAIAGVVVAGGGGLAGQAVLDGADSSPARAPEVAPQAPAAVPGPSTSGGSASPGATGRKSRGSETAAAVRRERAKLKKEKLRLKRLNARSRGNPGGLPADGRRRRAGLGVPKEKVRRAARRTTKVPRRRRALPRRAAPVRPDTRVRSREGADRTGGRVAPLPDATVPDTTVPDSDG